MKTSKYFLLLIAALLMLAVPMLAQTSDDSSSTVAAAGDPGGPLPDAPAPSNDHTPPSAIGRPTAGGEHMMDKEFFLSTGVLFGSTFANVELTHRCLESGACSLVPRTIVQRRYLYGISLPADAGITVLSYYLKRSQRKWWFVPAAVVTAGNVVYGIHAAEHIR